jgi:hypothetical protein
MKNPPVTLDELNDRLLYLEVRVAQTLGRVEQQHRLYDEQVGEALDRMDATGDALDLSLRQLNALMLAMSPNGPVS